MAQQIKIQDGIVVYSTSDPITTDVDFTVKGVLNVTKGFTADGNIILNTVAWPDGTVPPTPGMYLGVSALNTLQFYTLPVIPTGAITINTQAGPNYTIQLSDAYNTLIRMTSAVPATVTIEDDGTVNMPIGSAILIGQNGLGSVTIVPGVGVTVDSPDSLTIGTQYGKITAIKVGADHWEIEGNLAP